MAGLKAVAKFQQSSALIPYDPQSTTSANVDLAAELNVVVDNLVNVDEITPPVERRIPKPGLHLQSPYAQQLSSSSKAAVVKSKVKGLCALDHSVVDDVNDEDEKAFDAWFKSGLLKRPTYVTFMFISILVVYKIYFFYTCDFLLIFLFVFLFIGRI
ncbi:uncharacterized protein LOC133030168 [Cannabis sativa]|uniref:uncharacterized protein LOC133030168 n=1 Tax=Cannabis sativa TaxID=3483 RepID=UPI0029CA65BF|nr:uncharacterized protein LOC133030168 [Cannabis sativa]